ncbi:MAG: hypothetical protein HYX20_02660 [Candidatus Yanofskybacteria bacterium]|nr:hypothetical protein [Candidatus Yanofskybacteria bacterium]
MLTLRQNQPVSKEVAMPYDIVEDKDYTGVRCSDCGKVIAAEFSPYHAGIDITQKIFYDIQDHSRTCPKTSRSSDQATARA